MNTENSSKKVTISKALKRIATWLILIFLTLYLTIWALSPALSRWQINDQLMNFGLQLTDESTIRLNPFLLRLSISDLALIKPEHHQVEASIKSVELDIDTLSLISKELLIEEFTVDGIELSATLTEKTLNVAGFTIPQEPRQTESEEGDASSTKNNSTEKRDSAAQEKSWLLLADRFQLTNISLLLDNQGNQHRVTIESLSLSELVLDNKNQQAKLELKGIVDSAPIGLNVVLENQPDSGNAEISLTLEKFELSKIGYLIKQQVEQISGQFSLSLNQSISFTPKATTIQMPNLDLQLDSLQATTSGLTLNSNMYKTSLNDMQIDLDSNYQPEIKTNFSLESQQTQLKTADTQSLLFSFDVFQLEPANISLNKDFAPTLKIGKVILKDLITSQKVALQQTESPDDKGEAADVQQFPPMAKMAKLQFSDLELIEKHLSLNSIEIEKLNGTVALAKNRQLANLVLPGSTNTTPPNSSESTVRKNKEQQPTQQETPKEAQPENTITFSLNRFSISEDSLFTFSDASIQPAFLQNVQFKKVELTSIDSRDPQKQTKFDIQFKTDAYAGGEISGFILPFTKKINLEVNSKIREFSLPQISPYMKDAMGFEMLNGQFDIDVAVKINDDIIVGDSRLEMRGLELSSADDYQANSLNDQTAMPLNSALGMLKDDKGNLELEIPLTGDVSQPEFGVTNLIAQVTKKAIMSAAESYLIKTFIPYANVLSVAKIAGEFMLKVRFEDLIFKPQSVEIQPEHTTFMQEFSALLKDKPETQIKVCAIATPADLPGITPNMKDPKYLEQLKAVSSQRAEAFKAWVVQQGKVESSRLLLCHPQVDSGEGAKPRIQFEA